MNLVIYLKGDSAGRYHTTSCLNERRGDLRLAYTNPPETSNSTL